MAASGLRNIEVNLRNIKINIDSKEQKTDLEPFIYNGSKYVPLRFVSEKLGNSVDWNDKTSTIDISQNKDTDLNELKAIQASNGLFW